MDVARLTTDQMIGGVERQLGVVDGRVIAAFVIGKWDEIDRAPWTVEDDAHFTP